MHRDDVRAKAEYHRTNVEGAENVALVCEEKGIDKIIFTSTVAVYGFAELGTDENGAINPFNEYGRTKFEAEGRLPAWYANCDKPLIVVRPTVIFGEGNSGNVFNLLTGRNEHAIRDLFGMNKDTYFALRASIEIDHIEMF